MKPRHALVCTTTVFVFAVSTVCAALAQAQGSGPQPESQMIKPPAAASGAASATNPDNMPVKKPDKPTNDKIIRTPPTDGANPQ